MKKTKDCHSMNKFIINNNNIIIKNETKGNETKRNETKRNEWNSLIEFLIETQKMERKRK